jgi:hypothetical protein
MPSRPSGSLRRAESQWNQAASAMITAILASSDGWPRLTPPTLIQRRAPMTVRPATKMAPSRASTRP